MKRLILTSLAASIAMAQTGSYAIAQSENAEVEEIELTIESNNTVEQSLKKAEKLRKKNQYVEAKRILTTIIKEEKSKEKPEGKTLAKAYKELSEVLKLQDKKADFFEALEYANAYSENREPELERAAYYMNQSAGVLTKNNEHKEAEILLRRADAILKSKPDAKVSIEHRPVVLNNLSNSLIFQNRFDEAARVLEIELDLRLKRNPQGDKGSQNARHKLGVVYSKTDKLDKAIEQRKKYLEWAKDNDIIIGGDTRDVLGCLVDNYLAVKNTVKAVEAANSFYDQVENDKYSPLSEKIDARYRLASAYVLAKNYETAFKQLENARALIEEHCGLNTSAEMYLLIKELDVAMMANNAKKVDEVKARIEKVTKFRGSNTTSDAHNQFSLAKIYAKHNKLVKARSILTNVLALPAMNSRANIKRRVLAANELAQVVKKMAGEKGDKVDTITVKDMDLSVKSLDSATAREFGLPDNQTGLLVTEVDSKSDPVFQEGDIIGFVNGKPSKNVSVLKEFVSGKNKKDQLSFFIIRYGEGTTVVLDN